MPRCAASGQRMRRNLLESLYEGLFSAAALRLWPQQQAIPLQQGLMTPQPSALRTSFRALCITRLEIKESVIYADRRRLVVEWKGRIFPEIELNDATRLVELSRWRNQFNPGPFDMR